MKITALSNRINSILFGIQNPEVLSDAVTSIDIYDEDELIASATLSNNNFYESTDLLGAAVELSLSEGG